jgi:hypothetical protein
MKIEYDCDKCGIHVVCAVPVHDETLYCSECRFTESIEDPAERKRAEEFFARKRENKCDQ